MFEGAAHTHQGFANDPHVPVSYAPPPPFHGAVDNSGWMSTFHSGATSPCNPLYGASMLGLDTSGVPLHPPHQVTPHMDPLALPHSILSFDASSTGQNTIAGSSQLMPSPSLLSEDNLYHPGNARPQWGVPLSEHWDHYAATSFDIDAILTQPEELDRLMPGDLPPLPNDVADEEEAANYLSSDTAAAQEMENAPSNDTAGGEGTGNAPSSD